MASFERWRQGLEVTPIIVSLRERLHELGRAELERFRKRSGPLSEDQERELERMIHAIVQKVLHPPIRRLRESVERGDMAECASLLQEIFGIDAADAAARTTPRRKISPHDEKEGDDPQAASGPRRVIEGGKKD